jgi:hypothetical protein
MRNPDDPYKTLGLSPDATLREVRAAYESSLLKCYGEYSRGDLEAVRERLRGLHEAYVAVLMTAASSQPADPTPRGRPGSEQGRSLLPWRPPNRYTAPYERIATAPNEERARGANRARGPL